jgi:peptide/nickel transport system substrate-binding protein
MISRRALLGGGTGLMVASLAARSSMASGRAPYGGSLILHAPWPLASIDPHRIDDAAAALFGEALFETLYAHDAAGGIAPCLAEGDPELDGTTLRVKLRTGVSFASGAALDARAAVASIARARSHGAGAWLSETPPPRVEGNTLVFATQDASKLARALASPLVAVVSPRFSPQKPDGTGPFRARLDAGALVLTRNTLAAGGPALLDEIEVRRAADLVTSLRAFESGDDDVGWLGSFLHEPRQGARAFDAGAVAWAILRTGSEAGPLDTPGMAQALADAVPHAALAPLVVGAPWPSGVAHWTGTPCDLLVRDDSPWLVDVARAVAVALSSPTHEVTPRPVPSAELARRRTTRGFSVLLDVARPASPHGLGALLGLATADDPASAAALLRHPPRGDVVPRTATRTMRVGVVGEVRLQGGRASDVVLPTSTGGSGVDWGSASRTRRS